MQGGKTVALKLERAVVDPHPHSQFPELYIPSLGKIAAPIVEGRKTYYRDIAVIALPSAGVPTMDEVLDISEHMEADGQLHWDAPAGEWTVVPVWAYNDRSDDSAGTMGRHRAGVRQDETRKPSGSMCSMCWTTSRRISASLPGPC